MDLLEKFKILVCQMMVAMGFLIIQAQEINAAPVDLNVVSVPITDIELLIAACLGGCAMMWQFGK